MIPLQVQTDVTAFQLCIVTFTLSTAFKLQSLKAMSQVMNKAAGQLHS